MSDQNLILVLKSLEPAAEALTDRPGGVGHTLHIAPDPESGIPGFLVCCADRHPIGTITKGPGSEDYIAIENPGSAIWTTDPSQTSFDPTNPLCFCGKGPAL